MLLALVGVTGVGKTYYTNKIVDELEFKKINTIKTRKKRENEIAGKSAIFMTKKDLDRLENENKIAYRFSVFGGEYAYLKEEIFSKENSVFEMHYTTIYDWKKIKPDIKTIYIYPKDIKIAKQKVLERNLSSEKEEERIREIDEHYKKGLYIEVCREYIDDLNKEIKSVRGEILKL